MSAINEVMYGKITRLSHTWRYSAQPVLIRENVAEHSFWTALIGITIAHEIGRSEVAGSVAVQGLLHDIEECMTGDLVRDMKYASPEFRQAIKDIEEAFVDQLLGGMGMTGGRLYGSWRNAKDNTLAGRIVTLADALSVISYCTKENSLGNINLFEIRRACVGLIEEKFYDNIDLWPIAREAITESFERWPG